MLEFLKNFNSHRRTDYMRGYPPRSEKFLRPIEVSAVFWFLLLIALVAALIGV